MQSISETVKILIIVNVIVFVGALTMWETAVQLFAMFYYENPLFKFWQPLTSMFMHGGIAHLAFNMIGLWMFGTPLERNWGAKRFLFFYFSAGLGAALVHMLSGYIELQMEIQTLLEAGITQEQISFAWETGKEFVAYPNAFDAFYSPVLGASGAVYGILVAFALSYPNAKLMLIFLPVPIKAKYFVPALLLLDTFAGISGSPFGIAHWAHVGGAFFGFIMAWSWRKSQFNRF